MKQTLRLVTVQLFALLLLGTTLAQAQDRRVTGKVTTASDGMGLPGANVQVKGTTSGTVTDADGNFSLSVSGGNPVLIFSSIGFNRKEVAVGNQSTINVALEDDIKSLSEV